MLRKIQSWRLILAKVALAVITCGGILVGNSMICGGMATFRAAMASPGGLIGLMMSTYILTLALAIGIFALCELILDWLLKCDFLDSGSPDYPCWAYVQKIDRDEVLAPVRDRTYTICVRMTRSDLVYARRMMKQNRNQRQGYYWKIPRSYVMSDKVTCLVGARIALRDIRWALKTIGKGEAVYFVYYRDYPEEGRRSKRAKGKAVKGETVIASAH